MSEVSGERRRGDYRLLIFALCILASLAWFSRFPQVALNALLTRLDCVVDPLQAEVSPDGRYVATRDLYLCGGAAGSVAQKVQVRSVDDQWGRFVTDVFLSHQYVGITWAEPRHLVVSYGGERGRSGPDAWGDVQITYQALPPCTVERPGPTHTPCILDQTR